MSPPPDHAALQWVRRVNRAWFVRNNLEERAGAWLDHLAALNDSRLHESCEIARAMCAARHRFDDPKPWFYAGIFSLATPGEAREFLAFHRVTKAAIPAMADDDDVRQWMARIAPETRELVGRLRQAIIGIRRQRPAAGDERQSGA